MFNVELVQRLKRIFVTLACFAASAYLARAAGSTSDTTVVPLMFSITAVAVTITGVATFFSSETTES